MTTFKNGLLAGCVSLLLLGTGQAQQAQEETVDQEASMQKWIAFMTPGVEHEVLKQKVGTWTVEMEMRTAPDAPAIVFSGTAEAKLVMGDRYLKDTIKCDFQGQPFEGSGTTGFDKLKKKYVSVWIDNFGTGFTISSGTYDTATKTFQYATMSPDIELGEYKRTRTVERIVSNDQWVAEMYNTTADGKEFLTMKAVYKRVK